MAFTEEDAQRIYGRSLEEIEADRQAEKAKRERQSAVRSRRWSDLPAMVVCPLSYRFEGGKWIRGCSGVAARRSGSYECSECGFRWDPKGIAQMDRQKIRKVLKLGKLRKDRTGVEGEELVAPVEQRLDAPGGENAHLGAGASVEAYRG